MRIPEVEGLRDDLAAGASVPVVLLAGGDDAVRDGLVGVLADDLRAKGFSVQMVRVDAEPAKTDAWMRLDEASSSIPMFGDGFVVVVSGCDGAKMPDELKRYLAAPPAHVRVALFCDRKPAGLGKAVEAVGRVVSSVELKDRDATGMVQAEARAAGVSMDSGAVAALVDMVGSDRSQIMAAIAAFQNYKGKGARVGADDLRGFVSRTRESKPWDLGDAIDARDLGKALKLAGRDLQDLGRGGQIALFHRIVRHARQLLMIRDLIESGTPDKEAMRLLNFKTNMAWKWDKMRQSTPRYAGPHLRTFLRDAQAMEIVAKRADQTASPEAFVADLLMRLIGAGTPRRR